MVKPRENRIPIMMSDEEVELLDDWRFSNRVGTRSDAVRRLIQIGARGDERTSELLERAEHALRRSLLVAELCTGLHAKDHQAWEEIAKYAIGALSENVEAQTFLVSSLAAISRQSAELKGQGEIRHLLEKAEKIRQAGIFENQELIKAFSSAVEDEK